MNVMQSPVRKTIGTALQWACEVLEQSAVPEPALNAEFILAHVCGIDRLLLKFEGARELNEEQRQRLETLIERRRGREPLQYILGTAEFMGLVFEVNSDVLIPRPETEILVERALEILRNSSLENPEVLDVGTGSGNIALSLAAQCPSARIVAMDVSDGALRTAVRNGERNVIGNVEFARDDLFRDFQPGRRFDLILSNPPYISLAEIHDLAPEIRSFEPQLAITDGGDGFRCIRRLLETASDHLRTGGFILIEVGFGQSGDAARYAARCGLTDIVVHADLAGIPRVLQAMVGGGAR